MAEEKAATAKKKSVTGRDDSERVSATAATDKAIINCIEIVHQRLLFTVSTSGLHKGLKSHGSAIKLVSTANFPLLTPRSFSITREIVFTMKYGSPSVKYKVGIHDQGDLLNYFSAEREILENYSKIHVQVVESDVLGSAVSRPEKGMPIW